jgi:drug/metabolite transporter (DMT)-like permease
MAASGTASLPREAGLEADRAAFLYLALMVLINSSTAGAVKLAVRELPVGLVPLARFGVAGLCLLPLAWRGGSLRRLIRTDFGRLALAAAFCVPVNQSFLMSGTKLAPTSHVAIIYAACPLVVLLLATALRQERMTADRLLGVLASVAGVVVIGLGNLIHGSPEGGAVLRGDLLLVGAVTSWGAYLTVSKPLVARHGALPTLAATFLLGAVFALPIALVTLPREPFPAASRSAWMGLAYLILVVTVLGLAFQNQALRRLDASQVATAGNAASILAVVWGVWLFREPVTPALLMGAALTLGGILWTGRPAPQPDAPVAAEPR